MYSKVSTLTGHLESFASFAKAACLTSLGQLAMQYQLLEVVEEAFIVHNNILATLVLAWLLAQKGARKKERLVSTVYTLISS